MFTGRFTLALILVSLSVTAGGVAQTREPQAMDRSPATFTAFAINMSNVDTASRAGTIEIRIERWSTEAERDRLVTTFKERGAEALLDALEDLPRAGYIRAPGSLGYHLHYAWQAPLPEGGRQIVLLTDRYIGFWEARNRPRSIEYPFTLVELRLGPNNEGVGKVSIAAKITGASNDTIALENFASEPVRLTEVRKQK